MSEGFLRKCKVCCTHVFLTSKYVLIRDETVGYNQYLCWECWSEISAAAAIGYALITRDGKATRVIQ